MKRVLILISIFVYIGIRFCEAQSFRDRIGTSNNIDGFGEDHRYSKSRPIKQRYTERADEDDDLVATDRRYRGNLPDNNSNEMVDEFQSDLKRIRGYAQRVRPVAKNMRRALNSRRGLGQEMNVILDFLKSALLSLIENTETYLPVLKPLTQYIRQFLEKAFNEHRV